MIVWLILVNTRELRSCSSTARMIGGKKPKTRRSKLISTVLEKTCSSCGSVKISVKFSKPTHSLRKMPRPSLRSLKATMKDSTIGQYWKMTK